MQSKRSNLFYWRTSKTRLVYNTCADLPLYNFIEISITGELEKFGVTAESWQIILTEFGELSENKSFEKALKYLKQISFLTNKLNITYSLVNRLSLSRNNEIIDILRRDLGYNLSFKNLSSDLQKVLSISKADIIKRKNLIASYDSLKTQTGTITFTRADWETEIAILRKYVGSPIDKKTTTVSEYLAIRKQYSQYVETIESDKKGKRTGINPRK